MSQHPTEKTSLNNSEHHKLMFSAHSESPASSTAGGTFDDVVKGGGAVVSIPDTAEDALLYTAIHDSGDVINSDEDEVEELPGCRGCCSRFMKRWKYVFHIIALFFLTGLSGAVMMPLLPGIKRRYFGGDKEAAFVQTTMQCISAALSLILCPISGYAMDVWGRRPFFVVAMSYNVLPPVLMLIFYPNPFPYMLAQAIGNLIIGSYAVTYVADHYKGDKGRVQALAAVAAGSQVPTVFGFLVMGVDDYTLICVSIAGQAAALLFTLKFIKESLPQEFVQPFDIAKVHNPFKAMKVVLDSRISVVAIAIMGMFQVSQSGVGEVYFYYLNERVGFNKGDNAIVFLEAGTMWPFVMLVVIPLFTRVLKMHSISMVLISVIFLAAELTLMCVVNAKWQIFALALPCAAMVNMSFPALTAVIADGSSGEDQGRRQAGLSAISDFFGTLAPLFFGQIYSHVDAFWSFLPFAIAAVLCAPTFAMAYKLRYWIIVKGQRNMSVNNSAAPTPKNASLEAPSCNYGLEQSAAEEGSSPLTSEAFAI